MVSDKMIEELEEDIKFSLESFEFIDMHINSLNFLKIMGFESQRRHEYVNHLPSEFLKQFDSNSVLNKLNAHYKSWKEIGLIFQYSASEMKAMNNSFPLDLSNFSTQSILFFFINLKDFPVTKKDLNEISFEVNKIFRIPCFIIFKYCNYLAISITEKRLNKILASEVFKFCNTSFDFKGRNSIHIYSLLSQSHRSTRK